MDTLKLLDGAFTSTGQVVATIGMAQLDTPTPCAEWDVRSLLNHMTGVVARFGDTAARREPASGEETDWVGSDPGTIFVQAATATLAAWSRPGALEGMCRLPIGVELPAEVAARINFLDTLVHGWDLARAIGRDPTLDPALAAAALEVARMVVSDERRGPGKGFGPAIDLSAGASATDQLVAFMGRQP